VIAKYNKSDNVMKPHDRKLLFHYIPTSKANESVIELALLGSCHMGDLEILLYSDFNFFQDCGL